MFDSLMMRVVLDYYRTYNHGFSPKKSRYFLCYWNTDSLAKYKLELNDKIKIRMNKNLNFFVIEA